jgi:hypothetical protein
MKKWGTELKAIEANTGILKLYVGPNIDAPTKELAQQWCDQNQPYLKVIDELVAEIPCKEGTHEPDFSKMVDYENIQHN